MQFSSPSRMQWVSVVDVISAAAAACMLYHSLCVCVVPPNITSRHETTTLTRGRGLSIPCVVEGFPVPMVTWTHNNSALPECTSDLLNMNIVCVESTRGGAGVLILSAEEVDAGRYACTAVNPAGMAIYEVFITVERETS